MGVSIAQGFVIKKQNYADHDLIITILLPRGKLAFLARGVRKLASKNRVALQLGNFIEIEVFRARLSNKLSKLKTAHLLRQFPLTTADSAEIMLGILTLLNKIDLPHAAFYNALTQALPAFGDQYNHHIKTYFKFLNLKQHGLNPVMDKCYECATTKNIADFNFDQGGFMCQHHAQRHMPLALLKAYHDLGQGIALYLRVDSTVNFEIHQAIVNYARQYLY